MRLIGTISQPQGLIFSEFLNKLGIIHQMEIRTNQDWGSPDYGVSQCLIWIQDEDLVPEAKKWLNFFLSNPNDPCFSSAETNQAASLRSETTPTPSAPFLEPPLPKKQTPDQIPWDKQPMGPITRVLILLCTLLLILSEVLTPKIDPHLDAKQFAIFTSPVEKNLLYDFPYYYELVDQYLKLYGGEENPKELPKGANVLLNKINETPVWQGFYSLLLAKNDQFKKLNVASAPMFEKISQGQIWRLFTPALLHADIFHLFFNMLWLMVLGKQIEQRLTPWSYIAFILTVGIFSNTIQYLSGGPNFIGFSGVLCGMLTFIWERQKKAPWEGYDLNRLTYLFMMIFILGMASIQIFSFFIEKSFNMGFSPSVANAAHLSGAFIGYLIGKTNIFSWRHS